MPSLFTLMLYSLTLPAFSSTEDIAAIHGFEAPGWSDADRKPSHVDRVNVHSGEQSRRLEVEAGRTWVSRTLPVTFAGQTLELTAFVKMEEVDGYAGLSMQQMGAEGKLGSASMKDQGLHGTADWAQLRLTLDLDPEARSISYSAVLDGSGRVWIDDVSLTLDGVPLSQAPIRPELLTPINSQHDFDAGSDLPDITLSALQIDNLALQGRVWGFLKFMHPAIRSGELHWDYELFRTMPRILAAESHEAARAILVDQVASLGAVPPCAPCQESNPDVHLAADLDWLSDETLLGVELSQSLRTLVINGPAAEEQHYYSIDNELDYPNLESLDFGYRVLALFRFWNIVAIRFPYRDQIDGDWAETLTEMLPRVASATTNEAFSLAMIETIARISDTHTNLWGAHGHRPPVGVCTVDVHMRFVEDEQAVVWLAGPDAALEPGDVVTAIDGTAVEDLVALWLPLYPGSNRPAQLRGIGNGLLFGECGPVTLEVRRGDATHSIEAQRTRDRTASLYAHDRPGPAFQILEGDIAYLKMGDVEKGAGDTYYKSAKGTAGWVIDLRNYPKADMVYDLAGHFMFARRTEFAHFTKPSLTTPGEFTWSGVATVRREWGRYREPIVILVDEVTQSAAEFHSMAFRAAPNAIVIGSTTAGADGNVFYIPLPGPYRTVFTGFGVFYPDRTPTQRVGIVPDRFVAPTIKGIRAGRDEVLEAAVAYIREQ